MADSVEEQPKADKFRKCFEDFLNMTQDERRRAERRRDYRDLKQWDASQVAKLEARKQAPIVFDQFSQKVDSICGLEVQSRSDPKALPVHKKQEQASEVITDALRFVESKQYLDETFSECFEDKLVEGYDAIITEVEKKGKEWIIQPRRIPWDRCYYDPYSRNHDFSDSTRFGITLWMYVDDAVKLNTDREEEIRHSVNNQHEDDTFSDRPNYWVSSTKDRIRVNQEYYLENGKWKLIYYSGDLIIIDPKDSPYKDDDGNPMCPIEMDCDYVDRDNNRWGYMERLIDVQDEINHRRSKALYMLSRKKVIATAGAFLDKTKSQVLSELAKAEAYLERNPNSEVEIDDNTDLGSAQLNFYRDATVAMDSVGTNPELSGRTEGAVSGRAFIARQQSGMAELSRIFARHSNFKRRVYRQIWFRMHQYWKDEKWIRVSDNQNAMRFVGLNVPVTFIEKKLEERTGLNIQSLLDQNPGLQEEIQQQVQADPRLGEVVETRNNVKELDMDIILEEAPDSAVLRQEQFETIANLAASRGDPQMFRALVMLSDMSNKKQVLEMFEGNEQESAARSQAEEEARQVQMQQIASALGKEIAETENIQADTAKKLSEVPLNQAKAQDEMASAAQKFNNTANTGVQ